MKTLRTCEKGHAYYKSSDCPVCEQESKPEDGFLSTLPAPARRALENNGITEYSPIGAAFRSRYFETPWWGPDHYQNCARR